MTATLIGIAGGSGAGKSWLAHRLNAAFDGQAAVLSEDDYYICSSHILGFDPATHDFDVPQAKDYALMKQQLAMLQQGKTIDKPVYDFGTHKRTGTVPWKPRPFIIVEGLHLLVDDAIRALLDAAIWIEAPDALRYERRLRRDVAERDRTAESVLHKWQNYAAPAYERYAAIQRDRADMVLTPEMLADMGPVITSIKERLAA